MNAGAVAALARRRTRGCEAGGSAREAPSSEASTSSSPSSPAASSPSAQLAALRCGASDGALLFLHADTRLPPDALRCVQLALARHDVVAGGFVSFPESPHKTWYFQAIHNGALRWRTCQCSEATFISHTPPLYVAVSVAVVKTHYLPLLLRPVSYARGRRVLFGDQAMFCRAAPFAAVGGFDESVPLMEDADLCLKLHAHGPRGRGGPDVSTAPGRFRALTPWSTRPRGRLVQLSRSVGTDGRRFEQWGNARATRLHFIIGAAWYFQGADAAGMRRVYDKWYGDMRAHGQPALPTQA